MRDCSSKHVCMAHNCIPRTHILLPEGHTPESIRAPADAAWLHDIALRDLALHEKHAACIDAKGDVYQWGEGFFDSSRTAEASKPLLTLRGKVCECALSPYKYSGISSLIVRDSRQ